MAHRPLKDKVILISGASRGIGKAIALRCARDGARIALAAKTATPHPKLPGTIYTAAKEVEAAGGQALPIICDIRSEEDVNAAVDQTVKKWGKVDILVNNASAIALLPVSQLPIKKFDLMNQINYRGAYLMSQAVQSHMPDRTSHILNLSPPPSIDSKWYKEHTAYSIAKFNMSLCVLGMAEEFKPRGIAVNALWPKTVISTAAISQIGAIPPESMRNEQICADAAYAILCQPTDYTGNFCVDETVLKNQGVKDFEQYRLVQGSKVPILPDFFLEDDYDHKPCNRKIVIEPKAKL